MPGFITHYLFGCENYKKLEKNRIKQIIKEHRNVYNIGLQGPDIFFYFLPNYILNRENVGTTLHTKKTDSYFKNMIQNISKLQNEEERKIALAYIAGFLGHYCLDNKMHPFIYYRTNYNKNDKKYIEKHFEYETDLDFLMCKEYYKRNFNEIIFAEYVRTSKLEKKVISNILYKTIRETYTHVKIAKFRVKKVVDFFEFEVNLLRDNRGMKRRSLRIVEKLFLGYSILSPLCMSSNYKVKTEDVKNKNKAIWYNLWNKKYSYNSDFDEIFLGASKDYIEIMQIFNAYLEEQSEKMYVELTKKIGNYSYQTGLKII